MSTVSFQLGGALGEALLGAASEAVLVADDVSWRVVAANDAAVRLYGGPLAGIALEALFGLEGEQGVERALWRAQVSDEPIRLELETRMGETREVRARARRLELDGCTACLVVLEDATRERELERRLEALGAEHRALLDALGIGVVALDSSGRVLEHNRFAPLERAFGTSLVGRNFFLDVATSPEARAVFQRYQAWAHALDAHPYRDTFEFEAGRRVVEAELQAGAGVGGWDALVRLADATDRYAVEQELRLQSFQAEEAARRTRLVYQTASLIHRSLDLAEVLETAVAETGRLLGASRCQVALIDARGTLRVAHEYSRAACEPVELENPSVEATPIVAEAIRALHPLAVESTEGHPLADSAGLLAASGSRAAVVAPIAVQREARGVLAIHQCDHARRWTEGEVELAASVATQVGLAIGHVEIHERVRRQAERESIVARVAVVLHAGGPLDEALVRAAEALGEAGAIAVAVAWSPAGSDEMRMWAWRRDEERMVASDPTGRAADAAREAAAGSEVTNGLRLLTARFATREGGEGALALEIDADRTGARETRALAEPLAVHIGLSIGAAAIVEEVTAAKQVWEGTFDAMPDGIVIHDAAYRIVRANHAFSALVDSTPDGLVGRRVLDLFDEASQRAVDRARVEVETTGRPVTVDLEESATGRYLSVSVSRLETATGPCYVQTVRDVTDGRHMQERLAQSAKMASIGHLAAGVAHEINTPLATIAGSAQSLARQLAAVDELQGGPRWPAISDRLEAIVEQSFRCKRITHDLLSFAAPVRPHVSTVDLGRVAAEAVETVERDRATGRVRLRVAGSPDPVTTDAELLRQVVINLVVNALDAIEERPAGRVTVEVRALQREARIAVRDTGAGVEAENLDRIFDPFFTTKAPGRGTGLGLSISQTIVASLGGRIEVESRPGRGATFTIKLPREAPGAAPGERR